MTDYYSDCRWFLRESPDEPYVEVTRAQWLLAENSAGFRGGGVGQPATSAWTAGNNRAGVIVYPHEDPPLGAIEWGVSYEWATRVRAHDQYDQYDMPSFANHYMNEEERARDRARRINEKSGREIAVAIRRKIVTHDWEEVTHGDHP